jgi:trigger factor
MQVQVEKTGPTQRKVSVTVPAQEVDATFDRIFKQVGRTASIPGFRQGKVPRSLIEAHYGVQVTSEVQNELVSRSLAQAIRDEDLSPVTTPQVQPGKLTKGDAFSFTADLEIQPNIELKQYKGLYVPPIEIKIEDQEIDLELTRMRTQAAQLVPVMIRDVVETGDIVLMDYEASAGGVPVKGGKADNAMIEVGGDGYLPGFSDGLLGAKVPSEREIVLDFPAEYSVKELSGKKATFKVKIKELKRKELPALDDDFAKDLGAESLAALKDKIRASIEVQKKRTAEQERRTSLYKALAAANPFDVPPSLITSQTDRMIAGAAARVQQMMGREVKLSDQDLAQLRKDSTTDAELQVRSGMLLIEVAKNEELKVESAEIEGEVDNMAAMAGDEAPRLRAYYADPENRSFLTYRLLEDKTVKFLLDHAAATPEEAAKAPKAEKRQTKAVEHPVHDHDHDHAHEHHDHDHGHEHAHEAAPAEGHEHAAPKKPAKKSTGDKKSGGKGKSKG